MHKKLMRLAILGIGLTSTAILWGQPQVDTLDTAKRQDRLMNQPVVDDDDDGLIEIPELYEDELEDLGPQYLLLEAPRRKWIRFSADMQLYRTSNVNLSESDGAESDVWALTLKAAILPYATKFLGGELTTEVGYQYQMFRYGILDGPSKVVNGSPVFLNDFQNRSPYAEIRYVRGSFFAGVGMRYSQLYDRETVSEFYEEYVPSWWLGHSWTLTQRGSFSVIAEGNYRFTQSESFGILPDSWNDKMDHSIAMTYSHVLGERMIAQAGYLFQYSRYLHVARERNDYYHGFSLLGAYFVTNDVAARVFSYYEVRESSEPVTADYDNWNLGLGGSLSFAF